MVVLVVIFVFVSIALPLAYAWRVFRLDEPSLTAWMLCVADAAVFVALVLLVGRWDIAGYYTRIVLLSVFCAAVLWSLGRHVSRPWRAAGHKSVLLTRLTTIVSLLFFGGALAYVVSGMMPPSKPRELAFPLKSGRFMIGQGGGIGLLNHHSGHAEQRYAIDITAVNELGFRAAGILPDELERYVIYGASVVSPCDGEVTSSRDDLPDLIPPSADPENAVGNHVVLDCGDVRVELAHLQEGSIKVTAGDRLAIGQAIGSVGNSGNTTEPHLHVHAVDKESGKGVPMSFGGIFPIRNGLYAN